MAWRKVWIWERELKGGTTYCLRWHDDRGKVRTETVGPDRKLAERLRTQREAELNSGKLNESPDVSYEEFKETELDAMKGRLPESSWGELERSRRKFGEITGVEELSDITPAVVEKLLSRRLGEVSPATANKNLRTVKAALTRAVDRGHLEENPASKVTQVPEPEREIRVLSKEEVQKLLEAAPSLRWKALISLGVTTGMRRGEMLALRWKDVDLEDGTSWVRNTPDHHTKSGKNRTLGLRPHVCELLGHFPRNGPYVSHTKDGNPMRNNVQRDFGRIVEKAGIDRCTLHDLRRTFISHLAMAGVNASVVKELAGHASIATTSEVLHAGDAGSTPVGAGQSSLRRAQRRGERRIRYVSDG